MIIEQAPIDDFVIDHIYQKISNKVHYWTGKNNFSLGRGCRYLAIAPALVPIITGWGANFIILWIIWVLVLFIGVLHSVLIIEPKVTSDLTRGLGNYLRPQECFLRVMCLVNTFLTLPSLMSKMIPVYQNLLWPGILFWLFWLFLLSQHYFEACLPLPPCRGRIQEWFSSFFTSTPDLVPDSG